MRGRFVTVCTAGLASHRRSHHLGKVTTPIWDDGAPLRLPALEGELTTDVCVIGLGGSGLAAIHALCAAGVGVVGLDAGEVAGGAAGGNGGFLLAGLAPFYHDAIERFGHDRARRLYTLTLAEFDRMAAETPELVRRTGSLRIAASAEERRDCERQLEAMRADGFPVQPYDGPEGDGLLIPSDGVFQPHRRARRLAGRALERGARLFEHSMVTSVRDGHVTTGSGVVRCATVLILVDGRLEQLVPALRGRVRSARLQMLATAPTTEVRVTRPVYRRWGYDYWQQLPDGRVVLGGCRDAALETEWTTDAEPTPEVQRALDEVLTEVVGVRRAPVTHRWAATVGYTTSGLPVCERRSAGVLVAGGYSGTGNVVGALCGRTLASCALGLPDAVSTLRLIGDDPMGDAPPPT